MFDPSLLLNCNLLGISSSNLQIPLLLPLSPCRLLPLLPRSPPPRSLPHNQQQHGREADEQQGQDRIRPSPAHGIHERQQDGREHGPDLAAHEIVRRGRDAGFARVDVDHEDVEDLEAGRQGVAREEEEHGRRGDADLDGEDPAVGDEEDAAEEEGREGDLEARPLDGEVRQVLFAVPDDGDRELGAPASVVPVDEAAAGEGGQDAAEADGEEHEADLDLVVAVFGGEGD